jgi:hypothetical protein
LGMRVRSAAAGNRIAIRWPEQIRVLFARRFVAQTDAPFVSFSKSARVCLGHCDLSSNNRRGLFADQI